MDLSICFWNSFRNILRNTFFRQKFLERCCSHWLFFCSCKSCLCSLGFKIVLVRLCSANTNTYEHGARKHCCSRILVKGMKFLNIRKGFGDEKHWLLFSCVNAKKKGSIFSNTQKTQLFVLIILTSADSGPVYVKQKKTIKLVVSDLW